jgi:hypothetical protein
VSTGRAQASFPRAATCCDARRCPCKFCKALAFRRFADPGSAGTRCWHGAGTEARPRRDQVRPRRDRAPGRMSGARRGHRRSLLTALARYRRVAISGIPGSGTLVSLRRRMPLSSASVKQRHTSITMLDVSPLPGKSDDTVNS